MTSIFEANGKQTACTIIEAAPNTVTQIKTQETDGYTAVQLGFGDKKEKHTTKPVMGQMKKASSGPKRLIREFRVSTEVAGKYEVGAVLAAADIFTEGQLVDITSKTKGKGYAGVIRRWGFHGMPATHGHHEFYRHGGSIGNREFPGRVFKNRKMAGQLGNEQITVQNVRVAKVIADKNLVLVHGAVAGGPDSFIALYPAVKKKKAPGIAAAPTKAKK